MAVIHERAKYQRSDGEAHVEAGWGHSHRHGCRGGEREGAAGQHKALERVGPKSPVEGLDGAGKTTLVTGLTEALDGCGLRVRVLREPGGVISGCLADIDPIDAPLEAVGGLSVTALMGSRWRKGLHHFGDVHETARLRWMANAKYRPALLNKFAHKIENAVDNERAA